MTAPKIFFTSDLHLGHANIIKYSNRPFPNVEEMNEDIIGRWNEDVTPQDIVYILGDVSFDKAQTTAANIRRLNGNKILIYGNHDRVIRDNANVRGLFSETHDFLERDFKAEGFSGKGVKIVMCHYAMRVWNKSHHGSLHLYGHSHGSLPDNGSRSMDVGMDANGMRVVSLEDVIHKIGKREIPSFDHHGTKDPR